jgi:hypothetical protein
VAIWQHLEPQLKGYGSSRLHRVRLYESRNNFVDYYGRGA